MSLAFEMAMALRQALPRDSSLLATWDVAAAAGEQPSESLVEDSIRHLVTQISALARATEHDAIFAPVGTEPDISLVLEAFRALSAAVDLRAQPSFTQVPDWLGELNGACQMLASRTPRLLLLSKSIATEGVVADEALHLILSVFLRVVDPARVSALDVLELFNFDVATAVAAVAALFRPAGARQQLVGGTVAIRVLALLRELASPDIGAEMLRRSGAVEETGDCSIRHLHAWQLGHVQDLTLALIQFDVVRGVIAATAAMTATAGGAEDRNRFSAALLDMIRMLVAQAELAGTARLLGRHLAVHAPAFAHRLLGPFVRQLLAATGQGGISSGAAEAVKAAVRYLRTVRWLLVHAPELRPQLLPLCGEWLLRALCYCPGSTGAAALATATSAGALPKQAVLALSNLDGPSCAAILAALPGEVRASLITEDAIGRLQAANFWDTAVAAACADKSSYAQDAADEASLPMQVLLDISNDSYHAEHNAQNVNAMGSCGWPHLVVGSAASNAIPGAWLLSGIGAVLHNAPLELRCAIDRRLCVDPCRSPDGVVFERHTIEAWLRHNPICPILGAPLVASQLRTDDETREALIAWLHSDAASSGNN